MWVEAISAALCAIVTSTTAGMSTPSDDGQPRLTLRSTLERALTENPRIRQARFDVRVAQAAVRAAGANFDTSLAVSAQGGLSRRPSAGLPSGSVRQSTAGGNVSYLHRLPLGTELTVSVVQQFQDSPLVFNLLAPVLTSELRVQAAQPILRGAGPTVTEASIVSARHQLEAAKLDYLRIVERTAAAVATAYWLQVRAQDEVEIRKVAVGRAQRLIDLTQELADRGLLAGVAILEAQSGLHLRRTRFATSQRTFEDAQTELAQQVLLDAGARIVVGDALPDPRPLPSGAPSTERSDVRALIARTEALKATLVSAEDQTRPRLDVSLSASLLGLGGSRGQLACDSLFGRDPAAIPAGCRDDGPFEGGLAASLDTLFTGGYVAAGINATLELPIVSDAARGEADVARLRVRSAEQGTEAARRQVMHEIEGVLRRARRDREAWTVAKEAKTIAQKLIEVEEDRYKVGSASTIDVLRVQDDVSEAEILAASAHASVVISEVALALARGQVLEFLGIRQQALQR